MKDKQAKTFDAVQMMRDIRNKITAETQHMSFEDFQAYLRSQLTAPKQSGKQKR